MSRLIAFRGSLSIRYNKVFLGGESGGQDTIGWVTLEILPSKKKIPG
jgi:hypothetical protein